MRRLLDRVLEHPAVYAAWQAPFVTSKFAPVERSLATQTVHRVLDVGCGPGTNAPRFGGSEYVGVDINDRYLEIARRKYSGTFIHADLGASDLSTLGRFDTILVNSFLHHLPDPAVHRVLEQIGTLLDRDGRVHVLELVAPERRSVAKMMAGLDRGRFARRLPAWRELFVSYFEPLSFEPYMVGGVLWSMVYFQGRTR